VEPAVPGRYQQKKPEGLPAETAVTNASLESAVSAGMSASGAGQNLIPLRKPDETRAQNE
jgi:hypothetical protein